MIDSVRHYGGHVVQSKQVTVVLKGARIYYSDRISKICARSDDRAAQPFRLSKTTDGSS